MNTGCRVQDQLNTSEPIAPYIIGRELNLRKQPGRQCESNPQPSEQLRPMTMKTSASTETATTAYIMYVCVCVFICVCISVRVIDSFVDHAKTV